MKDSFQSELAAADPVSGGEDAELRDLVGRMAIAARAEATAESPLPAPWWKRRRIMIPLGIAGVVALTGAAFVVPLTMGINGMNVDPDALIPLVYTTDTGVDVSCRYGIYFGDPAGRNEADKQLAAFVADHDWTGIGQRIYDHAIANPFVPGRDGLLDVDTQERRDMASLSMAINHEIEDEIPDHLRDNREGLIESGITESGITDCKGQLH